MRLFRRSVLLWCDLQLFLRRCVLESRLHSSLDQHSFQLAEEVKSLLRRWPYWRNGHKKLFFYSIERREIELALSSARACGYLASTEIDKAEARLFQAKAFNAAAEFGRALTVLEVLPESLQTVSIKEELVAALLGLEQFERAHAILEKIPPEDGSFEAQAARRYLDGKVKETKP